MIVRNAEKRGVPVEFDDRRPAGVYRNANGSRQRIVAPEPRTPGAVASLAHEYEHVVLHSDRDQVDSTEEVRVCKRVLSEWWDVSGLPDRDQAAHSLGEALASYLTRAVASGTDPEAIREVVGAETGLLPYLDRLERQARARDEERRRERGEYVPRADLDGYGWNPFAIR